MVTHKILLIDVIDVAESLNVFAFDPDYKENEEKYAAIKREILGSDEEEDESEEGSGDEADSDAEPTLHGGTVSLDSIKEKMLIHDETATNLTNLR